MRVLTSRVEPQYLYRRLSEVVSFSDVLWYLNNVLKIMLLNLSGYRYRFRIYLDPVDLVYVIVVEDLDGTVLFADVTSPENPRPYLERAGVPERVCEEVTQLWSEARRRVESLRRRVLLLPLKPYTPQDLNYGLSALRRAFPHFSIEVGPEMEVPRSAYDPSRGQYRAELILTHLSEVRKNFDCDLLIGFTSVDIYSDDLNFVFSLQDRAEEPTTAIFSSARLHDSFYGREDQPTIVAERIGKQLIHIVWHHLGLPDCPNSRCVMAYVNSVMDVDQKSTELCHLCRALLIKKFMYELLVERRRVGRYYLM